MEKKFVSSPPLNSSIPQAAYQTLGGAEGRDERASQKRGALTERPFSLSPNPPQNKSFFLESYPLLFTQ